MEQQTNRADNLFLGEQHQQEQNPTQSNNILEQFRIPKSSVEFYGLNYA